MRFHVLTILAVLCPAAASGQKADDSIGDSAALVLFERRILPILKSPKPSSCAECHLSGVDLKNYIRPSQSDTFAALVRAGLVDLKQPDQSKILTFIARKPERPGLVREDVRQEEYAAFHAWIAAAASDPKLRSATASDEPFGPTVPIEVLRHARSDRVLASFVENVWSEVGRCAACHSPEKNAEQVQKHGEQISWITPRDPEATLRHMLDVGIIDVESPETSLLLTKPTEQVTHGGGQKMVVGDRSYKQFRRFLDDYAATAAGKYRAADEFPRPSAEVSQVSDIWLKLTDVPEAFDGKLLQVDLYRREGNDWSQERWATSDRPVFGKGRLWQHSLSLIAPRDSRRAAELRKAATLPPGRYLVKISIDQTGKLAKDFRAELGPDDLVGQVEVESHWPAGYDKMTVVPFPASASSRINP